MNTILFLLILPILLALNITIFAIGIDAYNKYSKKKIKSDIKILNRIFYSKGKTNW